VALLTLSLDGLRVFVIQELFSGDQALAKKNVAKALEHYKNSALVA
jgi:hypothetical protein